MGQEEAEIQHEIAGIPENSGRGFVRTSDPGATWFPDAGLGLFIHWGISSVFGNTDLSWGMIEDWPWDAPLKGYPKVTPRRYYSEGIEKFRPDRYEPEKWLEAAADAGFKYAVMTAKHHDGFALWPSAFGDIGTSASLGGRDFIGEFVTACRSCGLKAGIYYSPPDWYFNREYTNFHCGEPFKNFDLQTVDPAPRMPEEHLKKYSEYIRGQVMELLNRYGRIDIIWFDGRGVPENAPDPITVGEIRAMQPSILINPRMYGKGDFETYEAHLPQKKPDGWWELCDLLTNFGWGYTVHPYKSLTWFIGRYEKARSMGGNFLMNAGPMPSGELPDSYYERMAEIKKYLQEKGR